MKKKYIQLGITVIVLAIVIVGAFIISKQFSTSQIPATTKDSNNESEEKIPAIPFTLKDIDGNKVSLEDYKGKIVILNFWGSWCKYCVEEMPDFQEAHNQFEKDGDVILLAINNTATERNKDIQVPIKYIEDNNFTIKFLFDLDGSVSSSYQISGYPTTFIIDKEGNVYGYQPGKLSKESLFGVVEKLREEN